MSRRPHVNSETFVRIWTASNSLTEVSVRMARKGYRFVTPRRARVTAAVLRMFGVPLKRMPTSDLPDYAEQMTAVTQALPPSRPAAPLALPQGDSVVYAAPTTDAEYGAAIRDAVIEAKSRGYGPDFVQWYVHAHPRFRPTTND